MPSTLIQEQYVVVPTTLAATIGLEEAVLLQVLNDCMLHRERSRRGDADWIELPSEDAQALLPFWNTEQIERIARNLQNLGIIALAERSLSRAACLSFSLLDTGGPTEPSASRPERTLSGGSGVDLSAISPASTPPAPPPSAPAQPASHQSTTPATRPVRRGAVPMHDSWQPNKELLRKLKEINGIPEAFAQQLVPEFVLYWRDRQSATFSWEARFMKHANREWRQAAASREATPAASVASRGECAMHNEWRPSEDAREILQRGGIDPQFVDEAVPEFVLYWRDRGDVCSTWDSRFISHIRRQWVRYESSMHHATEPHRIESGWQPSEDVYDILRLANIDESFARASVAEFVVYWRDTNQVHNSWNSRFLKHVKMQWAQRHHLHPSGPEHGKTHQAATEPDHRSFVDKHTDQSWREGL